MKVKMYAEQMLKCTTCEKVLDESEFYNYKHEHKCKTCMSQARKLKYENDAEKKHLKQVQTYRSENKEKVKYTKLKQTYGITKDDYQSKLTEQDNCCAICKKPESNKWRGKVVALAVDHCHETEAVRGLLCMNCNRALGLLKENVDSMTAMIDYVKKYLK